MESKDLTIIIVTFKSEAKILNCLKSIPKDIPIIIVENSNNEIFQKDIQNQFSNVKCILTGENKGYSVANNIGLTKVKTKYALILNPDTVLDLKAIDKEIKARIKEAAEFAETSPELPSEELWTDVLVPTE